MASLTDIYTNAVIARAHVGHIKTAKAQKLVAEIDQLLPLLEPLIEHKLSQHPSLTPTEAEGVSAMVHLLHLSHDEKIQKQLQHHDGGSILGTLSGSLIAVMPELREALHDESVIDAVRGIAEEAVDLPDTLLKHL